MLLKKIIGFLILLPIICQAQLQNSGGNAPSALGSFATEEIELVVDKVFKRGGNKEIRLSMILVNRGEQPIRAIFAKPQPVLIGDMGNVIYAYDGVGVTGCHYSRGDWNYRAPECFRDRPFEYTTVYPGIPKKVLLIFQAGNSSDEALEGGTASLSALLHVVNAEDQEKLNKEISVTINDIPLQE